MVKNPGPEDQVFYGKIKHKVDIRTSLEAVLPNGCKYPVTQFDTQFIEFCPAYLV